MNFHVPLYTLNISKFDNYTIKIHPIELEITNTTETVKPAWNVDMHLEIDNERWLRKKHLTTKETMFANH